MLVYHFEGVPRSPVAVAIKNILTLGIHTKVWLYRINREMDGHEGFHIDLRWLGVMVAFPFLTPIIVKFQTVRRLNKMVAHQVTVPIVRSRYLGWISIVPVLGQAVYAWWVQSTLNRHWFWHRRDERILLAKERAERLAAEGGADAKARAAEAMAEAERLKQEIEDEIEATKIRLGPDRYARRVAYAERLGTGRLSRKEWDEMRRSEREARRRERAARKAERGPLFGLWRKVRPAPRDPDNDADWVPTTKPPARTPDEIRALAAEEGRDATDAEMKEIEKAEKTLARIEKEREVLAVKREAARAKREKEREKLQAAAEKKRLAAAAKAEKKEKAKAKRPKKTKAPKPAKKGKKPAAAKGIPVGARKRVRAAPKVVEVGDGPVRELTLTCPRCETEIVGVKKKGDAPAKMTCPTCGLVGKV